MGIFTNILTAGAENTKVFFNPAMFVENLRYMGIGMLVIFVIIAVIILATALINKIFSKK